MEMFWVKKNGWNSRSISRGPFNFFSSLFGNLSTPSLQKWYSSSSKIWSRMLKDFRHNCSFSLMYWNIVCSSSIRPDSIVRTRFFKWGSTAHPTSSAIYWIILTPVCLALQLRLELQTALRNGKSAGMPRAEAITANARAVVFLTYSSEWSMSGLIVEIMVARPAAFAKLEMISRPSTRA